MTKLSLAALGLAALIAAPAAALASDVDGRYQDSNATTTSTYGVYDPATPAARQSSQNGPTNNAGFYLPDSAGSSQGHGARAPGELR